MTSKLRIRDLALLGGEPAFSKTLHVGRPNVGNHRQFLERVNDILDSRCLTNNGRYVREFEKRLSEFLQVEHCVVVCNGTAGIEITLRALGLSGQVIVPSFTFVATAHALVFAGLEPTFCDVDPATHNIDPACVANAISSSTTAILGVHLWGRPCAIDELSALAHAHGLSLIFDSAHALGTSYRGEPLGRFGLAEVFSLHATKIVNSFEGGVITTQDGRLAAELRLLRNFGFADYDRVVTLGTNAKMNEVSAAMGLTNLEVVHELIETNRQNLESYRRSLADLPGIQLLEYNANERNNYQYVVLEVDEASAGLSRDLLLSVLHAEGVLARRYFYPGCHRMEPYRSLFPDAGEHLAITETLSQRVLVLPTGSAVADTTIQTIGAIVRIALGNARTLRHLEEAGRLTRATVERTAPEVSE